MNARLMKWVSGMGLAAALTALPAAPSLAQQRRVDCPIAQAPAPFQAPRGIRPVGGIVQVQAPSPVQRELERLYGESGQEMPAMNLEEMEPGLYSPDGVSPAYLPEPAPPAKSPSFLQRIFPFNRRPQLPPPAAQRTPYGAPTAAPQTPGAAQPNLLRMPQFGPRPVQPPLPVEQQRIAEQPQPRPAPQPQAFRQPSQLQQLQTPKTPVQAQPQQGLPPVPGVKPGQSAAVDEQFFDEDPADEESLELGPVQKPELPGQPNPQSPAADTPAGTAGSPAAEKQESPFTGLKLNTPQEGAAPEQNAGQPQVAPSPGADAGQDKLKVLAEAQDESLFKGFCPVALRDQRELIRAKPEFSSEHEGRSYQFSSAAHKAKFDRHPEQYVPAAGGRDVVALEDDGEETEGALQFASWYKGRLYLFASRDNAQTFMQSPADYAAVEVPEAKTAAPAEEAVKAPAKESTAGTEAPLIVPNRQASDDDDEDLEISDEAPALISPSADKQGQPAPIQKAPSAKPLAPAK